MSGTMVVPLVALVLPISLLLGAVVFDVAVVVWAVYRLGHDDAVPRVWRWAVRGVKTHAHGRLAHR